MQKLFAEQDFDPNRIDEEAAVRIGKMLGAKAVVVGSAHDYVNARMVNTETGTHIWNVRQTLDGGAEAPASVRRAVTIGMVGTLNKAVLGINLLEAGQLTTAERNIHGVTDVIGAVVAEILPGSPSEGVLQIGDVIRNIDGRPIRDPADVILAVFGKTPGDALNINLKRRGRVMTVTVISAAPVSY